MDGDGKLAVELLMQMKTTIKRLFIVVVILIVMLFATNVAWLYCWNLPTDSAETSISQDADDNGTNNYIGNDGDIDGEADNN